MSDEKSDEPFSFDLNDSNILPAGMQSGVNSNAPSTQLPSIKDVEGGVENPFTFDINDDAEKERILGMVNENMTEDERFEVLKQVYKDNDIFESHKEQWGQLSEDEKKKYQEMGEQIYSCMNEDGSMKDPLDEAMIYIKHGLDSGLHPRDLGKNELQVVIEKCGENWYEKWGWTDEDMKEVTIDPNEIDEA